MSSHMPEVTRLKGLKGFRLACDRAAWGGAAVGWLFGGAIAAVGAISSGSITADALVVTTLAAAFGVALVHGASERASRWDWHLCVRAAGFAYGVAGVLVGILLWIVSTKLEAASGWTAGAAAVATAVGFLVCACVVVVCRGSTVERWRIGEGSESAQR